MTEYHPPYHQVQDIPVEPTNPKALYYPFDTMLIGQSFLVPFTEGAKAKSAAKHFNQTREGRICVRKETCGYRVGRVE